MPATPSGRSTGAKSCHRHGPFLWPHGRVLAERNLSSQGAGIERTTLERLPSPFLADPHWPRPLGVRVPAVSTPQAALCLSQEGGGFPLHLWLCPQCSPHPAGGPSAAEVSSEKTSVALMAPWPRDLPDTHHQPPGHRLREGDSRVHHPRLETPSSGGGGLPLALLPLKRTQGPTLAEAGSMCSGRWDRPQQGGPGQPR